jgi:hypothetical protein
MSNVIRTLQILRESISSDEEYLTAVSMGNELRAQALVDEAAKKAGYNIGPVYHGGTFNINSSIHFTIGFYNAIFFATTKESAHLFGSGGNPRMRHGIDYYITSVYLKENIFDVDNSSHIDKIKSWVKEHHKEFNIEQLENGYYPAWEDPRIMSYIKSLGFGGFTTYEEGKNYAIFNVNQIKLTDPVTYDDDGDVIPLSKRFNPNSNDIRY